MTLLALLVTLALAYAWHRHRCRGCRNQRCRDREAVREAWNEVARVLRVRGII